MTRPIKMSEKLIHDLLLTVQWWFQFVFCIFFGVIASESYLYLRSKKKVRPSFSELTPKFIVAAFVCSLVHAGYTYKKLDADYEWVAITLAGFLHYAIGTWLRYDLWPLLANLLVNALKGGKRDDR